jgi:hypothetical protein
MSSFNFDSYFLHSNTDDELRRLDAVVLLVFWQLADYDGPALG